MYSCLGNTHFTTFTIPRFRPNWFEHISRLFIIIYNPTGTIFKHAIDSHMPYTVIIPIWPFSGDGVFGAARRRFIMSLYYGRLLCTTEAYFVLRTGGRLGAV